MDDGRGIQRGVLAVAVRSRPQYAQFLDRVRLAPRRAAWRACGCRGAGAAAGRYRYGAGRSLRPLRRIAGAQGRA